MPKAKQQGTRVSKTERPDSDRPRYAAHRLTELRVAAELSQSELARRARVDQSAISAYEGGRRRMSHLSAAKLAKALGVERSLLEDSVDPDDPIPFVPVEHEPLPTPTPTPAPAFRAVDPVDLAIPDERAEWKPPAVQPWPTADLRRDMIELLQAVDLSCDGVVKVERIRDLVRASIYDGPAVVCTREEWDDAETPGAIRWAQLRGTYGDDAAEKQRPLGEDDLEQLEECAVDYVCSAGYVAAQLGTVLVSVAGKYLVRGKDTVRALQLVEDLGGGAIRVRVVGRQLGCWIVPMQQTTDPCDEEGRLIPAYDDVAGGAAKGAA